MLQKYSFLPALLPFFFWTNWLHAKTLFSENSSAFSEEVPNRKEDTIKIISVNRETKTQLQQTTALRSSSSVLAFTGKSIFHFSKVYNISRGLEPMYSCCLVLYLCCVVFYSCCVVFHSCCLVLCRVISCCTRVVSCCLVLLLV